MAKAELEERFMRRALALARRAEGATSPNPLVGAVLVRAGRILGEGWHRRAGEPHAEIEALRAAARRGHSPRGATLFVTLEPCSTHGRTPPCTEALIRAGLRRVVVATPDPNPAHAGRGLRLLRRAGILVQTGLLAETAARLNESFNHWIVHRTPFVTVKAAMTLDGKIATASGESKWITGEAARAEGMRLRARHDAILVGVNTVLADNPSLTFRPSRLGAPPESPIPSIQSEIPSVQSKIQNPKSKIVESRIPSIQSKIQNPKSKIVESRISPIQSKIQNPKSKIAMRLVLDTRARTPLRARVVCDEHAGLTTVVVSRDAPASRVAALAKRVAVWRAPLRRGGLDLGWVLRRLGEEQITSLLVEGGGEVNASFLLGGFAQRVAFFYAPKILGGAGSRKAVAGEGARSLAEVLTLREVEWKRRGADLMMTALVAPPGESGE